MRIALLGLFGCGNSGNDGSLEAMVQFLRETRPVYDLLCICPNPERVAELHNIRAVSQGGIHLNGRAALVNRLLAGFPQKIFSVCRLSRTLQGVQVLIIPGTGILDDFQDTAFGWPFVLFRWCLAARLCGVPVAFVSIGAGPIKHPLSRWFLKTSARMSQYRSYRDEYSYQYLKDIGVDVSLDCRYPDLAFRLPEPGSSRKSASAEKTVGVGIMYYRGWKKMGKDSEDIYNTYLSKMACYIGWLIENGNKVRLVTGDSLDKTAVKDLLHLFSSSQPHLDLNCIKIGQSDSLYELMGEFAQTDIAVVSRYHNVVCALKMGRPTISLSYNAKNDCLLARFGQDDLRHHIETFEIEILKQQTLRLLEDPGQIAADISRTKILVRQELADQESVLLDGIINDDPERDSDFKREFLVYDKQKRSRL